MTGAQHEHRNDLTSFAFDPAGSLLATGSGTPPVDTDDFYDQGGTLVLFSVHSRAPLASIDVKPGGVGGFGHSDCLVFNPSGSLLVMSHDTNAIATLDLGLVQVGTAYTELNGGYPAPLAVAWVSDRELLLMTHAVVPAIGDVTDHRVLGRVIAHDPAYEDGLFSLGPNIAGGIALAMVMGHRTRPPMLVGIDVATCSVKYAKQVGPCVGAPERWITSPDGSRTLYADESITVIFDGPTGAELARFPTLDEPVGGIASARSDRWAIFGRRRTSLVASSGSTQELVPERLRDPWSRDLPDGAPLAFAPHDDDLVMLRDDGVLERRTGPDARTTTFRCRVGDQERCVRWPRPDTMVTFGTRCIVFRSAADGSVLREHAW